MKPKILVAISPIFKKYFLSYFVFFLLSLSFMIGIYFSSINITKKSILEQNKTMLEKGASLIETEFNNAEALAYNISDQTFTTSFIDIDKDLVGSANYSIINHMSDVIKSYQYSSDINDMIDFGVYNNQQDIVVSLKVPYSKKSYYQNILKYDHFDFDTWKQYFTQNPDNNMYYPSEPATFFGEKYEIITYTQSLPFNNISANRGTFFILFDGVKIKNRLASIVSDSGGVAYIKDSNENIICYYSHDTDFDIKNYLNKEKTKKIVSTKVIDKKGWTYYVDIPNSFITHKSDYILRITLIFLLLYCFLGIFFIIILAYKNSKPIYDICHFFSNKQNILDSDNKFGMALIKSEVQRIVNENYVLSKELEFQKPILKNEFLNNLVRGNYADSKNIDELLFYHTLDIKGQVYCVTLLSLRTSSFDNISDQIEIDSIKILIKSFFYMANNVNLTMFNRNNDEIIMLVSFKKDSPEECKNDLTNILKSAHEKLSAKLKINISFNIGEFVKDLSDIRESYETAIETIKIEKLNSTKSINWYTEISIDTTRCFFPISIETYLLKFAALGDLKKVKKTFQKIRKENFVNRNLSQKQIKELNNSLLFSFSRLYGSNEIYNDNYFDKQIVKLKTIENQFDLIEKLFLELTEITSDKFKEISLEESFDNYTLLIINNFSDSDFCIEKAAECFNCSAQTFYKLFKEKHGVTFAEMLQKKRIEASCKLLKNENKNIEEIANLVGYNSAHSFRRVFKKTIGISPSDYKSYINSLIKEDE